MAVPVLAGTTMMGNINTNTALNPTSTNAAPLQAEPGPAPSVASPASPPANANRISAPTAAPTLPLAGLQLTSFDPAFAQFASSAMKTASSAPASESQPVPSALLKDPVALDGTLRECPQDKPLAVLIDLDPAGGGFAAPATPMQLPEHAAALGEMRSADITIAWISGRSLSDTGAIRTALEQSGLDPRGEDILILTSSDNDSKQEMRAAFAAATCLIAIAGNERGDFDERFGYLRNPADGAALDRLIGKTWFLIRNIFASPTIGNPDR